MAGAPQRDALALCRIGTDKASEIRRQLRRVSPDAGKVRAVTLFRIRDQMFTAPVTLDAQNVEAVFLEREAQRLSRKIRKVVSEKVVKSRALDRLFRAGHFHQSGSVTGKRPMNSA